LIGSFNVRNALVAAACGLALGLTLDQVKEGLGSLAGVPGRFELVSGSSAIRVIVDYAHTPDSVRAAVGAASEVTKARVIAVLGAGGDRDIDKRPLMGASAALADLVIVTNDNPRSEDPGSIADAVLAGIPETTLALVELDRRTAIEMALDRAEPGDIVLVLGKGHETSQMIGNEVRPFSDRTVVRELLGLTPESAGSGLTSGSMSL
jgi:UDP-N-acetylmuramoyl-L-alanyl-D-glutamate--2,6-diaminopimelate ligase